MYQPIITQAGLNAAVNADTAGASVKISHIAIGDVGWTPGRDATALQSERLRVTVAGSSIVGNGQRHITALFNSTANFAVREVGFYLTDGTLFAVWSHASNVLFYATPLSPVIQGFDLLLTGVPAQSINVSVSGDLNLYYADKLASLAIAQTQQTTVLVDMMARYLQLFDKNYGY